MQLIKKQDFKAHLQISRQNLENKRMFIKVIMHTLQSTMTKVYIIYSTWLSVKLKTYIVNNSIAFPLC